ncbi:uncharacterized protein LOC143233156 isoform X2 [Tachypleus tridentatus]|uniref:uncharacterized protein LOC143233156 isoform X2 n=1 Tax=Tachypleus tridentatus TaxID=6853 RepID=UPI003FCF5349
MPRISCTCSKPTHEQMTYCDDSRNGCCSTKKGTTYPLEDNLLDCSLLSHKCYRIICFVFHGQRWPQRLHHGTYSCRCYLLIFVLIVSFIIRMGEACSSRSTPKPRAPLTTTSTTTRPNITFQTYACPEAYAKWYCLNGATCFSVKIGESILYNCECADGYMGQRCEFKDLDGSYAIKEREIPSTTASVTGGLAVLIMAVIVSVVSCMLLRRRQRMKNLEKHVLGPPVISVVLRPSLRHTVCEMKERTGGNCASQTFEKRQCLDESVIQNVSQITTKLSDPSILGFRRKVILDIHPEVIIRP